MTYLVNYSEWKAIFENTGNVNPISKNILSILSKYNLTVDELKNKLSILTPIDLPEDTFDISIDTISESIVNRINESSTLEYTIDIIIEIVSGIIDGIPLGATQVASLMIDILHTLSYGVRWVFSDNANSKIEYSVLTIVGMISPFIPVGGNVLNATAKSSVGPLLKVAPNKIAKAISKLKGKKLPLNHWSTFAKWKIDFMYVLIRIIGSNIQDILLKISSGFSKMFSSIKPILINWAKSSTVYGWIIFDYIIPVINKIQTFISSIREVAGLAELINI